MIDTKNVPAGGGTPTGTRQENDLAGVFPCLNCTTPPAQRQVPKVRVADFLDVGEKNGLTMKQLQGILPGDSRSIRARIERERRIVPICSNEHGYFLPASEDEVRQFLVSMRHRGRRVLASAANVERSAGLDRRGSQQLDGQEVLF